MRLFATHAGIDSEKHDRLAPAGCGATLCRCCVDNRWKPSCCVASVTLASSMPWAMRPPKAVERANASLMWIALLSPEAAANSTMSASLTVLAKLACMPASMSSTPSPPTQLRHVGSPSSTAMRP